MSYVTTFSPDLSDAAVNQDFLTLKAGDAATLEVLVQGFQDSDSITSIKLYAKLDVTDADNATNTIALTATLTTPTRDTGARLATFSLSSSNTVDLLRGRVHRIEVIATRSAVPYTRTVMYGFIAAAYPGSTVTAPSDEAYLRALGDATVLTALGSVSHGATGITAYTAGDMIYATEIATLAKLAIGTANKVLTSTGSAPQWVSSLALAGTLTAAGITSSAGLTVSGGTTAVQALTATSGVFSGSVTAGSFVGSITTAAALATGRTISITGDLAYTSPAFDGSGNVTAAGTLATVNANTGSFGSSTAIPVFTVNAKGLITAASTAVVVAPAGTLTGTTLASNVVTSSLTSVGVLASPHMTGAVVDSGGFTVTAGSTSLQATTATTLHATSTSALDGAVTVGSTLNFSSASSQVIPGVTSYAIRDNANSVNNWIITDAGNATLRGTLAIGGALSGVTTLATSSTINGQTISSTASFTGTLGVGGAATFSSTVSVTGTTTLSGSLNVSGTSTLVAVTASGLITGSNGLTISSGTSALQAVTALSVSAVGTLTVTSASATSVTAGPNGSTNPVWQIDSSTASQAAGLKLTGATAAGSVALAVISSGSNANLSIDAKGSGTIAIGTSSTGNVTIGSAVLTNAGALSGITTIATSGAINSQTISSAANFTGSVTVASGFTVSAGTSAVQALTAATLALSSTLTVTSASATSVTAGPNGATNPVWQIDSSTGSQAAGLKLTGAIAAGTVALAVISSGSNANLSLDAKGSGTISIGTTSTGNVTVGSVVHTSAGAVSGVTTLSMSSALTMTAAASKLIPGATSFSHRNNADSADNLLISDAGAVTTRSALTVSAGGLTVTAGGLTVSAGTSAVQALTATTVTASGLITSALGNNSILFAATSATTGYQYMHLQNTSGHALFGMEGSSAGTLLTGGSAYATIVESLANMALDFGTNGTRRGGFAAAGAFDVTGTIATGAPTGGAGAWKLGIANAVSPTSPNRTVTIDIGGTTYYLAAKTTND